MVLIIGFAHFLQAFTSFNWLQPSWGLLILGVWIIGSLLYAFTSHHGSSIHILLSIYISKLVIFEAPFLKTFAAQYLPNNLLPIEELAVFSIVFVILFFFLRNYHFRATHHSIIHSVSFVPIFSFLQMGLLISTVLSYLAVNFQKSLQPLIQILFINNPAGFVWLIAPPLFLILHSFLSQNREQAKS